MPSRERQRRYRWQLKRWAKAHVAPPPGTAKPPAAAPLRGVSAVPLSTPSHAVLIIEAHSPPSKPVDPAIRQDSWRPDAAALEYAYRAWLKSFESPWRG